MKCNLEAVEDAPFGVSELLSNLELCLESLWIGLGMQTHPPSERYLLRNLPEQLCFAGGN